MKRNLNISGIYQVMHTRFNELGDFLKGKEACIPEGGRFAAGKPLVVRLDGSNFSGYTRHLQRPFDMRFVQLMDSVSLQMAELFDADLVYCQSDEITLVFFNISTLLQDGPNQLLPFAGRYGKILSEMAGKASSLWMLGARGLLPEVENVSAYFDCRAYAADSDDEALLSVRWRMMDARKNGISQLASAFISHKQLQGVNSGDRIKMLEALNRPEASYHNLPDRLKFGLLRLRTSQQRMLTDAERERIPEKYRPQADIMCMRSTVLDKTAEMLDRDFDVATALPEWLKARYS